MRPYTTTELDREVIERRFTHHPPIKSKHQPERYNDIRDAARKLAVMICEMCPQSRERSLAITKLEEASFWANASIARNETENSRFRNEKETPCDTSSS